jgi:hypothetical protein
MQLCAVHWHEELAARCVHNYKLASISPALLAETCWIHRKQLAYEKLHSFVGTLGYCTKYSGKEHYRVLMTPNISQDMLDAGEDCPASKSVHYGQTAQPLQPTQ